MDQVVNLAGFDPALSRAGKPAGRLVHVQEEGSAACRAPGMLKHLIGPEPEGFCERSPSRMRAPPVRSLAFTRTRATAC